MPLRIAGALARGHELPGLGDVLPIPRSLDDLLRERLDRLSATARAAASTAAAMSRPTAETLEAALRPDFDVDAALARPTGPASSGRTRSAAVLASPLGFDVLVR